MLWRRDEPGSRASPRTSRMRISSIRSGNSSRTAAKISGSISPESPIRMKRRSGQALISAVISAFLCSTV